MLVEIPIELTQYIFERLDFISKHYFLSTCKYFYNNLKIYDLANMPFRFKIKLTKDILSRYKYVVKLDQYISHKLDPDNQLDIQFTKGKFDKSALRNISSPEMRDIMFSKQFCKFFGISNPNCQNMREIKSLSKQSSYLKSFTDFDDYSKLSCIYFHSLMSHPDIDWRFYHHSFISNNTQLFENDSEDFKYMVEVKFVEKLFSENIRKYVYFMLVYMFAGLINEGYNIHTEFYIASFFTPSSIFVEIKDSDCITPHLKHKYNKFCSNISKSKHKFLLVNIISSHSYFFFRPLSLTNLCKINDGDWIRMLFQFVYSISIIKEYLPVVDSNEEFNRKRYSVLMSESEYLGKTEYKYHDKIYIVSNARFRIKIVLSRLYKKQTILLNNSIKNQIQDFIFNLKSCFEPVSSTYFDFLIPFENSLPTMENILEAPLFKDYVTIC